MKLNRILAITGCILALGGEKTHSTDISTNKEQPLFCVEIPTLIENRKEKILTSLKMCREKEVVLFGLGENPTEDTINERTNKIMSCLPTTNKDLFRRSKPHPRKSTSNYGGNFQESRRKDKKWPWRVGYIKNFHFLQKIATIKTIF